MKLYRKIHIYRVMPTGPLRYLCSTMQSRRCKDAIAGYVAAFPAWAPTELRAFFAKDRA